MILTDKLKGSDSYKITSRERFYIVLVLESGWWGCSVCQSRELDVQGSIHGSSE